MCLPGWFPARTWASMLTTSGRWARQRRLQTPSSSSHDARLRHQDEKRGNPAASSVDPAARPPSLSISGVSVECAADETNRHSLKIHHVAAGATTSRSTPADPTRASEAGALIGSINQEGLARLARLASISMQRAGRFGGACPGERTDTPPAAAVTDYRYALPSRRQRTLKPARCWKDLRVRARLEMEGTDYLSNYSSLGMLG